jgi:choline dehydrogenase-like flavoprotein
MLLISPELIWNSLSEFGIKPRKECGGGHKDGVCWVPNSQDPYTGNRSHAGLGHYADVIGTRPNYDLLVGHKALRLIVDPEADEAPTVEYRASSNSSGPVYQVKPKLEVIISAGAIHTPQILQRSGIGHASFLQGIGINVTVDLPGVGENFHDHGGTPVVYNCESFSFLPFAVLFD